MLSLSIPNNLKIGDRVFYKGVKNPARIILIDKNKYFIEFKYPFDRLHDCQGKIPSGKGWVAFYDDLKKIEKR